MMTKAKYIVCAAIALSTMSACGDFLEDYSQDTAYVRSYEDLDELLLGNGYMPTGEPTHIAEPEGMYVNQAIWYYPYIHLMGDEVDYNINGSGEGGVLSNNEPGNHFFGYYTWQQQVGINADGTEIRKEDDDWNRIYKHINICNMVLADIDNQEARTDDDRMERQRVKGEAYFLRGAYYFTLANLYGKPYVQQTAATDLAVPIKLTEFIEDELFERNTVEEVYQQAINDLQQADELLGGTTRKSYYRANQTAARLLLSRLYLYKQDWDKAASYAQQVINAGDNRLQDLKAMADDQFFLNPKLPEIIFSMGTGGLRRSFAADAQTFGITSDFYSLYNNDNDLRKTYFVKWNADYNYPEYVKGGLRTDMARSALSANFLLRTAEAYLNLAEAAAYSGDEQKARQALTTLRSARFSADADVTETGSSLISLIRDERARELCLEGHRWFDLRRYAVCSVQPYTKTIRHNYTQMNYQLSYVTWSYEWVPIQSRFYELKTDDAAMTLPIPKEVIDFHIGMPNNARSMRSPVEVVNY